MSNQPEKDPDKKKSWIRHNYKTVTLVAKVAFLALGASYYIGLRVVLVKTLLE